MPCKKLSFDTSRTPSRRARAMNKVPKTLDAHLLSPTVHSHNKKKHSSTRKNISSPLPFTLQVFDICHFSFSEVQILLGQVWRGGKETAGCRVHCRAEASTTGGSREEQLNGQNDENTKNNQNTEDNQNNHPLSILFRIWLSRKQRQRWHDCAGVKHCV